MECATHPGVEAVSFCSNCGMALCQECRVISDSLTVCQKCKMSFASRGEGNQSATPTVANTTTLTSEAVKNAQPASRLPVEKGYPYCSPGVSLALGFIPGVGAICNGEYWKALLQVLVFSSLISLSRRADNEEVIPVIRLLAFLMYFYMPLEAYHVAKKQVLGLRGVKLISPFEKMRFSSITVGIGSVCLGVILQISQFVPETMRFLLRGWPLILVGIGVYNLTQYFQSK